MRKKSLLAKLPEKLSVRERLGISQRQYSDFCNVSESLLSMIEIHKRNWPSDQRNHATITEASRRAAKESADISAYEKLDPPEVKKLELNKLKILAELGKLKPELETKAFGYGQALLRLKTCLRLRDQFADENTIAGKMVGLWIVTADLKMRENSLLDQELLQIRIESLEKQLEAVERRLRVG